MPANNAEIHPQMGVPLDRAKLPAGVDYDWDFVPTRVPLRIEINRLRQRMRRRAFPSYRIVTSPQGRSDWTLFFTFLPDGTLADAQRDTLERLAALPRKLLVVAAAPSPAHIPDTIREIADALLWKDTAGFDFSAYAAGLDAIARHAPGSDVFVLNDSIIGPFVDLAPWFRAARWDLTGFTASSNVENHVQSYAWMLRDVTSRRLACLTPALSTTWSYDHFWGVVLRQETLLARTAARHMSVGAFIHTDVRFVEDPTWGLALPLLRAGFPFLKRSLLGGKLGHLYAADEVAEALNNLGFRIEALNARGGTG